MENEEENKAEEPSVSYGKKQILFFNSFEEENEFTARQRAMLSYDERLLHAEQLRRMVYNNYLLPDGTWMPIAKVLTRKNPHT